jgi:hypothetical protein
LRSRAGISIVAVTCEPSHHDQRRGAEVAVDRGGVPNLQSGLRFTVPWTSSTTLSRDFADDAQPAASGPAVD